MLSTATSHGAKTNAGGGRNDAARGRSGERGASLRTTLLFVLCAGWCATVTSCTPGGKAPGDSGADGGVPAGQATVEATATKDTPSDTATAANDAAATAAETAAPLARYDTDIPMVEYKWDPQAGDRNVSAEDGGPGFTGDGWETRSRFLALGVAGAPKGGRLVRAIPDWPATLRTIGKDSNTYLNTFVAELCFEGLLGLHPTTLEFIPGLATHWWISDDKTVYRFRLNPKARWNDGKEVTAADVVATYKLRMDRDILFPSQQLTFGKFEEPIAKSKYIVEVRVKEENWRNFLYFSTARILPAHDISIPGGEYLDKFQFRYPASSGPYRVDDASIVMNQSVAIKRRQNWWDEENPAWAGLANIDEFKYVVVRDSNVAFEMIKKGELDYFVVPRAQWWVEELDKLESVQRGLLLKRKFYTDAPNGTSGIAINMQKPPLDDIRIRKALAHLYDRDLMIEKLFYNEYEPLTSYYQGGIYQNSSNVKVEYDEFRAVELLEEAGWRELNAEGYRVKDGKEFTLTLTYRTSLQQSSLTIFQESCKRAGIRLELELVTPAAGWKSFTEKEYELMNAAWGGLVFPNPETSFHSRLADEKHNNNATGFKSARVDELCAAYDREYDIAKRIEIIREIDGLIYKEHPYVLGWYLPSQRVIFWNKYGMPKWGGGRTADYDSLVFTWWVDPEKEQQLAAARADASKRLPTGEVEDRFWQAWNAAEQQKSKTSSELGN